MARRNPSQELRDRAASGSILENAYATAVAQSIPDAAPQAVRSLPEIGATFSRQTGMQFHARMVREAQSFATGSNFGASLPAAGSAGGNGSNALVSTPMYYDPRYATPDKFYFPRTEIQANAIWRHLYRMDPAVSAATDMYAELPWSEFDLGGIEDPRIKQTYESMCSELNLLSMLPALSREYLMLGKCIPVTVYDARKNYWSHIWVANPDYVSVRPVPVPGEEPLLDLKPTPELKEFATSPDPRIVRMRNKLPSSILYRAVANLPIPLDPINASYISRRTSPYAYIGSSLYTRLYRVQMLEDFLTNATLAVAQRNAAPLRIFKLGDPQTGWVPNKADEEAFLNMLAIAETDPFAAIVYHFGLQVEYVGVSDRLLSVSREYDYIERVKFLALGISKSFLLGETSFASAIAGLQTLVERLQTFRRMFETNWIQPKLFQSVAKMNEFYERTPAELSHRVRTQKKDANLIVPKILWRKRLEPTQDAALLNVWIQLHEKGLASDRDIMTGAGLDLENSRRQRAEEAEFRKQDQEEHPERYTMPGMEGMPPAGPGGPGLPPMGGPGLPPPGPPKPGGPPKGGPGKPGTTLGAPVLGPPRKGSKASDYRFPPQSDILAARIWNKQGFYRDVHFTEVEPIAELLREGSTQHTEWAHLSADVQRKQRDKAFEARRKAEKNPRRRRGQALPEVPDLIHVDWDVVEQNLIEQGVTDDRINAIRDVLEVEGIVTAQQRNTRLAALLDEAEQVLDADAAITDMPSVGSDFLAGSQEVPSDYGTRVLDQFLNASES